MQKSICVFAVGAAVAAIFVVQPAHAKPVKCASAVGTWRVVSLGLPWTFDVHADGTARADNWNQMHWTCSGRVITLTNGLGAHVTMTISPDGNSISGTMTDGMPASGVRTSAPIAQASAAHSKAEKRLIGGKGSPRQRYCDSRWPAYSAQLQKDWNEEFDINDEGPLTAAQLAEQRRIYNAKCVAGEDPSNF